jgi:uncharacterized protein (TIGR02246 family)
MGLDERAIRQVHSAWIDAVNAGDLGRLLALMADDCLFLSPGQATIGRDGFSAAFSAAHGQARIHCVSELQDIVVVGEVAYTVSRDWLSVTPRAGGETGREAGGETGREAGGETGREAGGEAMELAGHRITVYRKQPDGRWLLARDAHTLSPASTAPAAQRPLR